MGFRIQQLSRATLVPIGFFGAGVLAVLGYMHFAQDRAVSAAPATLAAARQAATPTPVTQADGATSAAAASPTPEAPPVATSEAPAAAPASDSVSTLIEQATGNDAAKRAAAITALASAPKDQAVPALAQVLEVANEIDLPLALHSLHALAQRQGDDDDQIRNVVRGVVSHSSDEATAQAAQATLDEIERDLSKVASAGKGSRG